MFMSSTGCSKRHGSCPAAATQTGDKVLCVLDSGLTYAAGTSIVITHSEGGLLCAVRPGAALLGLQARPRARDGVLHARLPPRPLAQQPHLLRHLRPRCRASTVKPAGLFRDKVILFRVSTSGLFSVGPSSFNGSCSKRVLTAQASLLSAC